MDREGTGKGGFNAMVTPVDQERDVDPWRAE